jgi:lipoprotein signal peptidase
MALFITLTVLTGASDLWTKHLAFQQMNDPSLERRVKEVFDGSPPADATPQTTRRVLQYLHLSRRICFGLSFTLSTNPGVVFGIGWFPLRLVNLLTLLRMLFVAGFFLFSEKRHYWLHAALALLLGGAFGNLYDRLTSSVSLPYLPPICYHVRDFIDCSELGYPWVFNLSDAWLVIGVGMIIAYWLWTGRKARRTGASKKT